MKNITYLQPNTLEEASAELMKHKDVSAPFGGGTDALGLLKRDHTQAPDILVNLKKIKNLSYIKDSPTEGLRIGALTTINEIAESKVIREKYTVLAEAADVIASPQLRNTGTLGGNLCQRPRCAYFREEFDCLRKGGSECFALTGNNKYHAIVGGGPCYIVYPSDAAPALLALDASVKVYRNGEENVMPLKDLYVLPEDNILKENVLDSGDIITEIIVPPQGSIKSGYYKFMERAVWDFAMVSAAAVVNVSGGRITSGKLAFGGVAPVPWNNPDYDKHLNGVGTDEAALKAAASKMFADAEPLEMNGYKVDMVRNVTTELLLRISS